MLRFILALLAAVRVFFRSRNDTALEILALRQQLDLLKRKRPRPRLNPLDRLFWITDAIPFSAYHIESACYPAQESEILRL